MATEAAINSTVTQPVSATQKDKPLDAQPPSTAAALLKFIEDSPGWAGGDFENYLRKSSPFEGRSISMYLLDTNHERYGACLVLELYQF